ncbi:hypothetical protein KI387_004172 [Taxus chinensis]|uniref:Histidine kinase/HSP90-like ATPase domain-containing protein n=1 Tax=Taxus chinensis TaxID=29808 RepID=A0AA38GYY4_TAXCH|nr:hypothetical protein KI387_004172 [Taxus chinensis]
MLASASSATVSSPSVRFALPTPQGFAKTSQKRVFCSSKVARNGFKCGASSGCHRFSLGFAKTPVARRYISGSVRCEATVVEKETLDPPGEKHEYQAEVSRLLDLIVHSLYSHKEVFLRELVSNASDALDKLRFLSVTEPELLAEGGSNLEIRIKPDPENGIITVLDTGIGMTKQELIDCLGTIAQSGTSKFLQALKENKAGPDNNLIGQFGVGFYSAFLVAEKVVVSTKSPKSDKQYVWEGAADTSSYVIREETDPENLILRGTKITLYLKSDDKFDYSDPERIQKLVKNYSQFVSFPIYTWQEKSQTKEMRNTKDVPAEEYNEFYKKTFNDFLDPLAYAHFTTEGEVEFRSVLYVPGMAPLSSEDVMQPKTKNISLYVKRVFISDDFDGELVRIMKKRLVRKTFDMIQDISQRENKEDYKKFWENFGKYIKLGCIEDSNNHKRIAPLLRFFSSTNEAELISLDDYIENMTEKQNAIYYIASDSIKSAKSAPFLEKLVQKDIEVLYLVDPIDEVAIQNLQSYKEKKFVDISKEDLDLGDVDELKDREDEKKYVVLCDWMKQQLGEKVAKVQVSKRLSSSPCVLVAGKFGWSANMERLMKAQTLGDTSSLEFMRGRLNLGNQPRSSNHSRSESCKDDPNNPEANRAVDLLYDTALISSGFAPENPAELGGKIYEMMAMALGGRWKTAESERVEPEEGEPSSVTVDSEAPEIDVIEPSEVRTESDPWKN